MVFVPNKRNWLGNLVTFDFLRKDTILIICKKNQLEKKILKPRTSLEGHDPAKNFVNSCCSRTNHSQIEKCGFRLVTSVGQRKNSESSWGIQPQTFGFRAPTLCGSDVEHRSAESEGLRFDSSWVFKVFFFDPRSWQDEKHLSLFLYRAQNLPSLLIYLQIVSNYFQTF